MIQKIKKTIITLSAAAFIAAPLSVVAFAPVSAATTPELQSALCEGGNTLQIPKGADPTTECAKLESGTDGTSKVNDLIAKIINILSVIVGIIAVIMIIIGGFRYITSGGSSEKITSAKNTILYAIIGLIIVALAQVIVRFILTRTV